MHMGRLIKSEAVYRTPFWRAEGLSGQGVNDEGIASVPYDNSLPDGGVGVLFTFTGGRAADRLAKLSAAERRRQVLERFRRYVGDEALSPTQFVEPTGALRNGPAVARPPYRVPVSCPGTETRFAPRSDACISREPRPPTTGRGIWKAPSAPGSAQRARS